jgi:hypothetical protein
MAITKKPFRKKVDDKITSAIINRGGGSPYSEACDSNNENKKVTIRLSEKMLNIIDEYLTNCISNKTRTSWVREAVEEKIKREIRKEE